MKAAKVWDLVISILTTYYLLLILIKQNFRADSVMYALIFCALMYNAALKREAAGSAEKKE